MMKRQFMLLLSLIAAALGTVCYAGSFKVKCAHPEAIYVKWDLTSDTWELPTDGTPLLIENVNSGSPRQVIVKDGYDYIISEVKETVDTDPNYNYLPWASRVSDKEWSLYPGWEIELTYEIILSEAADQYDSSLSLTIDDPEKVNVRFNSDRAITDLEPGVETIVKFDSSTETSLYVTPKDYDCIIYSATKNGEEVSFANQSVEIANGDRVVVTVNFPDELAAVSFTYAEGSKGFITKVTVDGESIDFAEGFEAKLGSKIGLYMDTEGFEFESISVNGTALNYYGYEEYLSFVLSKETVVEVKAKPYEMINFTINVDNAEMVEVYKNEYYFNNLIALENGENNVTLSSKDQFISICELAGVDYAYFSVKDTTGKEYSNHPTEWLTRVYPTEGMAITILTAEPEPQEETAKVTFNFSEGAEGFITGVEIGWDEIEDFAEGFEAEIGSEIKLYFNTENYEDDWSVLVNGEEIELSWSGASGVFTLEKDTEITVNATLIAGNEEQEIKFTVNVDNASRVKAFIDSSLFGTEIELVNGDNEIVFTEDDEQIVFVASEGSKIVSVKDANGVEYFDPEDYSTAVTPVKGMVLTVVTSETTSLIDGLMPIDGKVDVYAISGACVVKGATPAQIKALRPGMYVIGNCKLVIE